MPGFLGTAFNAVIKKNVSVRIAMAGDGYRRLVGLIDAGSKESGFSLIKERFEGGLLFHKEDMKRIHHLVITNMPHRSSNDPELHYTLDAEDEKGNKIKGVHVPLDPSKQTVS